MIACLKREFIATSDEEIIHARGVLRNRKLQSNETVTELARDIESMVDVISPELRGDALLRERRFCLLDALPDDVAKDIKKLPSISYKETIAKAKELILLNNSATKASVSVINNTHELNDLKLSVSQLSKEVCALKFALNDKNFQNRGVKCYN